MYRLSFSLLFLISTYAYGGTSYELKCLEKEIYTDFGPARLELRTKVVVNGVNDYVMNAGRLVFKIGDGWTDQNVRTIAVQNKKNYRPRNYPGHVKFERFSPEFYGQVDLLIPQNSLHTGPKNFYGTFILTNVEDHWGESLSVSCTLR